MTPSTIDLAEVVHLIWSTQLDLHPRPVRGEPERGDQHGVDVMTGVVQISGAFAGALHLSCPRRLVAAAAATMFGRPEAEISVEDLRDALGEITNMTAGNLKSRIPGSNTISLPTVVEGTDYEVTRLDSDVVAAGQLELQGHLMVVTLFGNRDYPPRYSSIVSA